jgi:D-lactate dehydratase
VLIDAGAHWIEPKTRMDCVADGNIITGVIYRAHPEYIRLFVKALGGKVTGSDKRILFLCGVSSIVLIELLPVSYYQA